MVETYKNMHALIESPPVIRNFCSLICIILLLIVYFYKSMIHLSSSCCEYIDYVEMLNAIYDRYMYIY